METIDMIRALRTLQKKHEKDRVPTFEIRWSDVCRDVADKLEEQEKIIAEKGAAESFYREANEELYAMIKELDDVRKELKYDSFRDMIKDTLAKASKTRREWYQMGYRDDESSKYENSKKEDISNIIPKEIIDMIGIKPNDDVKVSRDEKGRTLVEIRRKSR